MMTNLGRLLQVPVDFRKKSSQSHKSVASVNSNFPSVTKVTGGTLSYSFFHVCVRVFMWANVYSCCNCLKKACRYAYWGVAAEKKRLFYVYACKQTKVQIYQKCELA